MFEFTESVDIAAPPERVWTFMIDLEGWWPASNPEHISLERLDDGGIEVGAKLRICERVAGVPCEAVGEITALVPRTSVTWESGEARYRWLGMTVVVGEGVTWRLEPQGGDTTRVSATVWATFPPGRRGRALEWAFRRVLNGVEKDREHTRIELRHLKRSLEGAAT